jgi:hypothetical protein
MKGVHAKPQQTDKKSVFGSKKDTSDPQALLNLQKRHKEDTKQIGKLIHHTKHADDKQ